MVFPGFYGNEQLKSNLSSALDRGQTAHFYLISGPAGSGKRTLAALLMAALECRSEGEKPCLACSQCRKAMKGLHPDVITVDDTEHVTIPVKLVREAAADLYIRPNEGNKKIYYVPRAQDLGIPGQNTLLKVLEEPPHYGVFLLLADNPDRLLPTVRSRCRELKMAPLEEHIILPLLREEFPQAQENTLRGAYLRSGGWLGQARELLSTGEDWLPQTREFARCYVEKDRLGLLRLMTPMEKMKRDQLIPVLTQWRELLASALLCRAGQPPLDPLSRSIASVRTPREMTQAAEALAVGITRLQGNISPGAVCGVLVWQLR